MAIPVESNLFFANGAKIEGLPPATAPGQPATFEQLGGGVPVEVAIVNIPTQAQAHEAEIARPGTLATQNIRAWLGSTPDNELSLLEGVAVNAECKNGAIALFISCRYFEAGNIKINYQVI